jgi:hypothetical protein
LQKAEDDWAKPKLPANYCLRIADFVVGEESLLHGGKGFLNDATDASSGHDL